MSPLKHVVLNVFLATTLADAAFDHAADGKFIRAGFDTATAVAAVVMAKRDYDQVNATLNRDPAINPHP